MAKKALHLTHEYESGGGVATVVKNLTEQLNCSDFSVDVVVKKSSSSSFEFVGKSEKFSSLEDAIKDNYYDLVHVHSISFSDEYGGGIGKLAMTDVPIVYTCHSVAKHEITKNAEIYARKNYFGVGQVIDAWLAGNSQEIRAQEQLLRISDMIVNMTRVGSDNLLNYYSDFFDKCVIVPNATTEVNYEAKRKPFEDKINLLYVGRFAQEKGVIELCDALRSWLSKHENVNVKFVGDGPEFLKMKNSLHSRSSQIEFAGWLKGNDLDEAYKWSDYVIVPSHTESFGIVPLEAMKHKRPVIVSDVDALSELYVDTKTAIPIDLRKKGFLKGIQSALDNALKERSSFEEKLKMDSMVERAARMVSENYTWKKVAGSVRAVYNNLLGGFNPEVSVVLTAIKSAPFLGDCVDSLLNQTHENYELIIVHDNENFEKVKWYMKHPRVRFCQSKSDVKSARNVGIFTARGKFITFMDSKDCALPNRLETLAAALRNDKSVGLVHAKSESIDESNNRVDSEIDRYFSNIYESKNFSKKRLLEESFINSSAVMIRLKALLNISGFEGDEAAIDYSLWLKLMNFIDFKFMDKTVTQFRV
jgi:glycosyltransferase involved in cell wall biosynthesis